MRKQVLPIVMWALLALLVGLGVSAEERIHTGSKERNPRMSGLKDEHVRLLRAATVVWSGVESGAPAVLPSPQFLEVDELPYEDIARRAGLTLASPPTQEQLRHIERLLSELPEALAEFLGEGRLKPGRYSYRNPLPSVPHVGNLVAPSHKELSHDATVTFDFTAEHAKLLRAARWEGVAMNPKRPYGNMTYFELDMLEILGEPKTARDAEGHLALEQEHRLGRLHEDMQIAVQVFLLHARFDNDP